MLNTILWVYAVAVAIAGIINYGVWKINKMEIRHEDETSTRT